ncbi:MAG: hypothetical protein JF606_22190 [Burkholderiales bacterium]|nr:hypothetical protein [Burkholderiales bacterium]
MNKRRVLQVVPLAVAMSALCGSTLAAVEYGTVVSSTPVIGQSTVPQRECYDEQVAVQQQRSSGGGAIVGAVIGAAVGNSVGAGVGRAAATALGAVAGAAVGDRAEANAQPPAVHTVQHCRTTSSYQDNIIGYDVVYDYAGARRQARLVQNPGGPGTQIALEVNVAGSDRAGRSGTPVPPANLRRSAPVDDGAVGQPLYEAPQTYYEDRRYVTTYIQPAPVYYTPYPAVVVGPPAIWIGGRWGYRHHRGW